MKRLPIRSKFALWTAGLVGLVVLAFCGATFLNLYREQLEVVDMDVAAMQRHLGEVAQTELQTRKLEELVGFHQMLALAIFDPAGQLVRCSRRLPEPIARAALPAGEVRTAHGADGQAWRVVAFPHGDRTIVLAHSLEEVNEVIGYLLMAFVLSVPVVVLLAGVGGWWVSGHTLSTLREFTATAENIRADQLHRRLPTPPANDEIRRLADVLNEMLDSLEKSFEQSKRFSADASHELRTPLTIMAGEIGRLLRTPQLPAEAERLALSVQEEIGRLQRITEHMLLLAQFDAGAAPVTRVELGWSEMVQLACEDADLLAATANVRIEASVQPGLRLRGDEAHLRRMLLNLFDNAVRYNRAGGVVTCTLTERDGRAVLEIANTGREIPAQARDNLFHRFYRHESARGRGGHGLGLSLCREIARAHEGDVVLGHPPAGWTSFVVTLPLAGALPAGSAAA